MDEVLHIDVIQKLNVQDGDVIVFPSMSPPAFQRICEALRKTFSDRQFLTVSIDNGEAIRVLHIGVNKQ